MGNGEVCPHQLWGVVLGMAYDQGVWPWGLKIHVASTLVGHLLQNKEGLFS